MGSRLAQVHALRRFSPRGHGTHGKKRRKKKGPCPPDASSHPRLHLASAELNLTRTGCGFFKVFQKSAEERRGFLF